MPAAHRVRRALMLALAAVSNPGCSTETSSCEGFKPNDRPFSNLMVEQMLPVRADGWIVPINGEPIDPNAAAACEAACVADLTYLQVDEVHACTLSWPEAGDSGETGGGGDSGDSGEPGDTGDTPSQAPHWVLVSCEVSGIEPGPQCIGGRASAAVAPLRPLREHTVGSWLAREAAAEAGSVRAFLHLARELSAHGAPPALVVGARAAAQDEVQHARAVARAARTRGASPQPAHLHPLPLRTLWALAVENAVEGCVHETYAAARAAYMAAHSEDPELRALFATLAADEAHHAELAAAVHDWARSQLPASEAQALDVLRARAWRNLAQSPPEPEIPGLPPEEARLRMIAVLKAELAGR